MAWDHKWNTKSMRGCYISHLWIAWRWFSRYCLVKFWWGKERVQDRFKRCCVDKPEEWCARDCDDQSGAGWLRGSDWALNRWALILHLLYNTVDSSSSAINWEHFRVRRSFLRWEWSPRWRRYRRWLGRISGLRGSCYRWTGRRKRGLSVEFIHPRAYQSKGCACW